MSILKKREQSLLTHARLNAQPCAGSRAYQLEADCSHSYTFLLRVVVDLQDYEETFRNLRYFESTSSFQV